MVKSGKSKERCRFKFMLHGNIPSGLLFVFRKTKKITANISSPDDKTVHNDDLTKKNRSNKIEFCLLVVNLRLSMVI